MDKNSNVKLRELSPSPMEFSGVASFFEEVENDIKRHNDSQESVRYQKKEHEKENSKSGRHSKKSGSTNKANNDGFIEVNLFDDLDSFSSRSLRIAKEHYPLFRHTEEEEREVVRKIDVHLLPFICCLYFVTLLNRSNIGNANLAGMSRDLLLTSSQYMMVLNVFYIAYILMQWSIFFYKTLKPRIFVSITVISAGLIATSTCLVNSYTSLLVVRLLLGIMQCCYTPGLYYYLSFFYFRHEQARRNSAFLMFGPFAAAISGLISYAIESRPVKSIEPWRMIFLVEGIPLIIIGIACCFAIPNSAETSYFLNTKQKEIAKARSVHQMGSHDRVGQGINFREILASLLDLKTWLPTIVYLCHIVSSCSLPIFMPIIIENMGFQEAAAQGLTVPPYILAMVAMFLSSHFSDKFASRGAFVFLGSAIAVAGYIMLALVHVHGVRYLAIFLIATGMYSAQSINLTWIADNQGSDSKKGAVYVFMHMVGETASIFGTRVYPYKDRPFYSFGSWVCGGAMIIACVACLLNMLYLSRLNKKLTDRYGPIQPYSAVNSIGISNEQDPKFRYIV